jgi:hypothetical protein
MYRYYNCFLRMYRFYTFYPPHRMRKQQVLRAFADRICIVEYSASAILESADCKVSSRIMAASAAQL